MQRLKSLLERVVVGLPLEWKVVRDSVESVSSSFFSPEKLAQQKRPESRKEEVTKNGLQNREVEDDGSTIAACCEPEFDLKLGRRSEILSRSGSSSGHGACMTHSSEKALIVVIVITSLTKWQKEFTATRNEAAKAGLLEYVPMQWKEVKREAEGCVIVALLNPCPRQAVRDTVEKTMENARDREPQKGERTTTN